MFRELITAADGETAEGTCTDEHAASLLVTAVRRGYRVEATRNGGAVITRDMHDGGYAPRRRTVVLEPGGPAGTITPAQRRDLEAIAARRSSSLVRGRIHAGFYTIPPASAARLIARGLVAIDGTAVSVSLSARLAMLAQDHRTRSMQPRGYVRPSDIGRSDAGRCRGGGRSGLVYDRTSAASCSCRGWSVPAEDIDHARLAAREHRQAVTAAMVRELLNDTTARAAGAGKEG